MQTRERLRARDDARSRRLARLRFLLAVPAVLLLGAAFGWPGLAAGAAAVLVHVLLARSRASRAALAAWHLVLVPALAGAVLAAAPYDFWFALAPVLLAAWLALGIPGPLLLRRSSLPARAAGLLAFALTLVVCARLPVKPLDRKVGPADYRRVTLRDLSERLYEDHRLYFRVWEDGRTEETVVDFEIPRPMSKRAVLEKLARETGLDLEIGYCGTGESLLWGMAPMGVHLRSPGEPR